MYHRVEELELKLELELKPTSNIPMHARHFLNYDDGDGVDGR